MCEPIFKSDLVTLYHANALDVIDCIDFSAFISDPPYGVNFAGKATKHTKASGGYNGTDSDIGVDVITKCLSKVDRGAVFPGNRLLHRYPASHDIGCVFCPSGAGCGPWGFSCFNPILFYGKRPGGPTSPSSLTSFHRTQSGIDHPCPKPIEWMTWLVSLVAKESDVILDPFAGSGTTLEACRMLGIKSIGIEIDAVYCDVAIKRLSQPLVFDVEPEQGDLNV